MGRLRIRPMACQNRSAPSLLRCAYDRSNPNRRPVLDTGLGFGPCRKSLTPCQARGDVGFGLDVIVL